MTIACPNCSTPCVLAGQSGVPGDASIQCPRCAHVFVSSDAEVRDSRKTLMFGLPAPPVTNPSSSPAPVAKALNLPPPDAGRASHPAAPTFIEPAAAPESLSPPAENEVSPDPGFHGRDTLLGIPFPEGFGAEPPASVNRARLTPVLLGWKPTPPPDLTPEPRVPIGVDSALQRERARTLLRHLEKGPSQGGAAGVPTDGAAPRGKGRRVLLRALAVGGILAGLAGASLYSIWMHRRQQLPTEATTALGTALATLRKDDGPAIAQAATLFGQLADAYPSFVEAKADRLLALALQLDNNELEAKRTKAEAEEKTRLKNRIEAAKSPPDWQSRSNALGDELALLQKQATSQSKQSAELKEKIASLKREIESSRAEEELPVLRARIVALGVSGDNQVIPLAERYHSMGGTDGWGTITLAEYAANTKATPDTVAQIRADLENLRRVDPAFMRAHVLAGRLALVQRHFEQAADALEVVVTINPVHELAVSLRGEARRRASHSNP